MSLFNKKKIDYKDIEKYIYNPTEIYELLSDNLLITAFFDELNDKKHTEPEIKSYINKYIICIFSNENSYEKIISNKKITTDKNLKIIKDKIKEVNEENIKLLYEKYIKGEILNKNYEFIVKILSSKSDLEIFTKNFGFEEELKTKIIKLLYDSGLLNELVKDYNEILNNKPSVGNKDIDLINCIAMCNYYIKEYNIDINIEMPNTNNIDSFIKIFNKSVNKKSIFNFNFIEYFDFDIDNFIKNINSNGINKDSENFFISLFIRATNYLEDIAIESKKGYTINIDNFLFYLNNLLKCEELYKYDSFKEEINCFRKNYSAFFLNKLINTNEFIDKSDNEKEKLDYEELEALINYHVENFILPLLNSDDKTEFFNDDFIYLAMSFINNNSVNFRNTFYYAFKNAFDYYGISNYINSIEKIDYQKAYSYINEGDYEALDKIVSKTFITGEVIEKRLADEILRHHINKEEPLLSKTTIKMALISLCKSSISSSYERYNYICFFQPETYSYEYGCCYVGKKLIYINEKYFEDFYIGENAYFHLLDTIFHEAKHANSHYNLFGSDTNNKTNHLSRDNMLLLKDEILKDEDKDYYKNNYTNYSDEIFSRRSGVIDTYYYLYKINPEIASNFLDETKSILIRENQKLLEESRELSNSKVRLQQYFDEFILKHPEILSKKQNQLLNIEYNSDGRKKDITEILSSLEIDIFNGKYGKNVSNIYGYTFMLLYRIIEETTNEEAANYYISIFNYYESIDRVIKKQIEFTMSMLSKKFNLIENQEQLML